MLVLHRGDEIAILDAAGERGLIVLEPGQGQPKALQPADGRPSVNALLAGLLAVLGCVQLLRGRTLGPASELMWNAYALAGLMRGGPGLPLVGAAIPVKLVQGPVLGSASSLFFYALAAQKMAQQEKQAAASGSASSMQGGAGCGRRKSRLRSAMMIAPAPASPPGADGARSCGGATGSGSRRLGRASRSARR